MTLFDWYVIGFLPVSVVLILTLFALNDWDVEKTMFRKEK